MQKNSTISDIILASGSIGLILMALLFEAILALLAPGPEDPVSAMVPALFISPMLELLLMCAAVTLIWAMHRNQFYGRIVPVVYLTIGLLMLYSNALLAVLPLPDALYALTYYAAPDTMVFHASGAVAALGLLSLWFWKAPEETVEVVETPEIV